MNLKNKFLGLFTYLKKGTVWEPWVETERSVKK